MKELVTFRPALIGDQRVDAVESQHLHEALQVTTRHRDWIKRRLAESNLRAGFDFEKALTVERVSARGPVGTVYLLTLDAAKHIAMMEKTDVAFDVRCYFIEVEKRARRDGTIDPAAIRDLVRQEARSIVTAEVRTIAAEAVRADFALLRREIRTLEGWTLEDFARRRRTTLTAKQARSIGGALAAICRGAGLPMGRQASEYRRGTPPRTYPRTVLELHFARLVDRHAPSPQLALVAAAPAPPQVPA
jgi:phage anti-repressor protein